VTQRYAALLRGVNVGRANRVSMADLRGVLCSLGYERASTLLNSGNVVFSGPDQPVGLVAAGIEAALTAEIGVTARVAVLTREAFATVVAGNDLVGCAYDPARLMVVFPLDPDGTDLLRSLPARDRSPEALSVGADAAYAWCPNGVTGSPVLAEIGRVLGGASTTRNWATVLKIRDLLSS
jgi:uncharacterized protein (DUF1697 family)